MIAAATLAIQLIAVRPFLNRRSDKILAGLDAPRSPGHYVYVGLEAIKVIALVVAGTLLLLGHFPGRRRGCRWCVGICRSREGRRFARHADETVPRPGGRGEQTQGRLHRIVPAHVWSATSRRVALQTRCQVGGVGRAGPAPGTTSWGIGNANPQFAILLL